MEEHEPPSTSGRPFTRSQKDSRKRGSGAAGTPLIKSPLLSDFFEPARKQARTAAPPTLRQIRKKGGLAPLATPQLSGYLGALPEEVRARLGKRAARVVVRWLGANCTTPHRPLAQPQRKV